MWASRSLPSVHIPEWCGREAKCACCLGNVWGPLVFAEKKDLNSLCFCFPKQNFIPCTQVMALLDCVTLTPGSLPACTPARMFHQSQPLPSFLQPTPDPVPNLLFSIHVHREKPVLLLGALRTLQKPRKECPWLTGMLCDLWQMTIPL